MKLTISTVEILKALACRMALKLKFQTMKAGFLMLGGILVVTLARFPRIPDRSEIPQRDNGGRQGRILVVALERNRQH
jgi:hypothetical protein